MAYTGSDIGAAGSQAKPRATKAAVIPDAGQRLAPPVTHSLMRVSMRWEGKVPAWTSIAWTFAVFMQNIALSNVVAAPSTRLLCGRFTRPLAWKTFESFQKTARQWICRVWIRQYFPHSMDLKWVASQTAEKQQYTRDARILLWLKTPRQGRYPFVRRAGGTSAVDHYKVSCTFSEVMELRSQYPFGATVKYWRTNGNN
jgi:hypothetical protein